MLPVPIWKPDRFPAVIELAAPAVKLIVPVTVVPPEEMYSTMKLRLPDEAVVLM